MSNPNGFSDLAGSLAASVPPSSSSSSVDTNSAMLANTEASLTNTLGFCHSCNKQNRIDVGTYTCTQCSGGFIELFNLEDPAVATLEQSVPPTRLLETRTSHTNANNSSNSSSNGNASDALNNYIVINSSDMNATQADSDDHEFSPLNAPLFQLIRRLNSRRHGTSNNNNNNESANPEGRRPPSTASSSSPSIDWSSLINTEASPPAHGTSSTATMPRGRTSLHYRLRRHGNPHMANSSTNPTRSELGSHSMGGSGSSRIPIYNRHRFQRSPASGFHFNFLDDDEILNDQGAIIITTLINQLRNTNRGAAPASDTQIQSLPVIEVDQASVDKISQCAVCMEEFLLSESAKQLPCKHLFHDPCIDQWLKLHATCPVCRKNINGNEGSEDQDNLESTRPTLLNIFPLNPNMLSGSGGHTSVREHNSDMPGLEPISSIRLDLQHGNSGVNGSSQSNAQSNTRRQPIRNRQLYRIQFRHALNNSAMGAASAATPNPDLNNNTNISNVTEYSLRPRRVERDSGIRATALLINPQWRSSTVGTSNNGGSTQTSTSSNEATSNSNPFSAFSLINDLREYQSQSAANRAASAATNNGSSNPISNNSRISNMMDRLLNRYRPNRMSHSFGSQGGNDHNESGHSERSSESQSSRVPTAPSISLRLGQLFRPRNSLNRRNGTTNESGSVNAAESAENSNSTRTGIDSDLYEIFNSNTRPFDSGSYRSSLRMPRPQEAAETESSQRVESNETFTENPSNYFDFSLFNRSQNLENNLLGRLFDIPEHTRSVDMENDEENDLEEESLNEDASRATNATNEEPYTITLDETFEDASQLNGNHRHLSDDEDPLSNQATQDDIDTDEVVDLGDTSSDRGISDLDAASLISSGASGLPQAKKRKTEST